MAQGLWRDPDCPNRLSDSVVLLLGGSLLAMVGAQEMNILAAAAAQSSVPTVTDLSRAVADTNDWRALGIFVFAVLLVLLVLVVWLVVSLVRSNKPVFDTIIPIRMAMEAAATALQGVRSELTSLVGQIASLTNAVDRNGEVANEAKRRLEEMSADIEHLKRERSK